MNNLLLSLTVLASTGLFCFTRHWRSNGLATENRDLASQIAILRTNLQTAQANLDEFQQRHAARREELKSTDAELAAAQAEEEKRVPANAPESEGFWPGSRPYFYLPKRYLKDIGYSPFTEDEHLTATTAKLFGMTEAERVAVDNAYHNYKRGVAELQKNKGELVEPKAGANDDKHREITYRIPALRDEIDGLRNSFNAEVTSAIGEERTGIFWDAAKDWLQPNGERPESEPQLIKYFARVNDKGEVAHHIEISNEAHTTTYGYGVVFPVTPGNILWRYRNLFGEEPLIPLPPAQEK